MEKFTSIPAIDGLFWYYAKGEPEPRPVLINQARYGKCIKSFNGSQQAWLRDGEYLLGPQTSPDAN